MHRFDSGYFAVEDCHDYISKDTHRLLLVNENVTPYCYVKMSSPAAVAAGARASGAAVLEPSSRGIKSSNDEPGARLLDSWACEELHELRVRHDESDKVLDGAVEHGLEHARLIVPLVVAAVAGHSSRERRFEEQSPLLVVKADDATDVGLKGEEGLG